MSWARSFFVGRVDERKTAWGERNGKKKSAKSSLCTSRYMSCLRDPEDPEPRNTVGHHYHTRAGTSGGNLGLHCGWQEDHYGKRMGEGVDLGLKAVDLGFEDGEPKGRKEDDFGESTEGRCKALSATDCWMRVLWVFHSKKFQSAKLERLYQRYFFRLNQSSLTMLMGVLVVVCGVMLTFHCIQRAPDVAYVTVLCVAMTLFLAVMVVCNRNCFHQDYMWIVSYLVIGVLIVVQVYGLLMVNPRSASEGVWWTVFFIYIIYTLLPVRMRAAVLSGITLSVIHTLTAWQRNREDAFISELKQAGTPPRRQKNETDAPMNDPTRSKLGFRCRLMNPNWTRTLFDGPHVVVIMFSLAFIFTRVNNQFCCCTTTGSYSQTLSSRVFGKHTL